MKKNICIVSAVIAILFAAALTGDGIWQKLLGNQPDAAERENNDNIELPAARTQDDKLAKFIYQRRSVRRFDERPVSLEKAADVLWSTIGITVDGVAGATRAAPSAGATNPLVIYLLANRVEGLAPGIYLYHPANHEISAVTEEDMAPDITSAGLGQRSIQSAPFAVIIAANYERTTRRYGERGEKYVHIEAGHAAQNANLMAESLGMGGVMIGAFRDAPLRAAMGDIDATPLLILPLGYKAEN